MSVEVLPFDGRYQPFWATSRDFSPQGILLFADHWIPEGCLVMLKLHTRLGVLKVTARLVHRLHRMAYGYQFIDLDAQQQASLDLLFAWIAASVTRGETCP